MGCDICSRLHHSSEECPLIGVTRIIDSKLPQRAFLTLPKNLECKTIDRADGVSWDIVTLSRLAKGTQFGPFEAPKLRKLNPSCVYKLPIFRENLILHYLDTTKLTKCNWMSLVRFTSHDTLRNTICYQLKDEIYFSVVEDINSGQPIVVGYSPGYLNLLERSGNRNPTVFSPPGSLHTTPELLGNEFDIDPMSKDDHDYFAPISPSQTNVGNTHDHDQEDASPICSTLNIVKQTRSSTRLRKRQLTKKLSVVVDPSGNELLKPNIVRPDGTDDGNGRKRKLRNRICYPVRDTEIWECKFCQVQMNTIPDFAQHLTEHYKSFKSIECKIATDYTEFEETITDDKSSTSFTCDICSKVKQYMRVDTIIHHLRIAHGSIAENTTDAIQDCIQCHACRQYFANAQFYKNHECATSINVCAICNIPFENRTDLRYHLDIHDEKEFTCLTCHKILTNMSYETHISACSTVRANKLVPVNINCCWKGCQTELSFENFHAHFVQHTHPFVCSKCFIRLRNPKSLNLHQCVNLQCDECEESCENVPQLTSHINENHSDIGIIEWCFECTLPFATMEGYMKHGDCEGVDRLTSSGNHLIDENIVKYVCEFCGATYSNMSSLKTHRNTHSERQFVCEVCNKGFSRKSLLFDHYHVHDGDPKFSCSVCDKRVKTMKSLSVHMRTHRDRKPFSCEICGKGFSQKVNLQTHSRSHIPIEEKKQEGCDQCGKKFSSREYLKLHQEAHQTGGKYSCDICNSRSFLRPYILQQHKKTVHGNDVYKCNFCEGNLRFRQKYSLQRHLTKEHLELKESWEVEGYLNSMLVPGDGSLSHPKNKKTTSSQKESQLASTSNNNSSEWKHAETPLPIKKLRQTSKRLKKNSSDVTTGEEQLAFETTLSTTLMPEGLEIENEVTVGEEESCKTDLTLALEDENSDMFSKTIVHSHKQENMVLLQLDDASGHYVIAFSHDLNLK